MSKFVIDVNENRTENVLANVTAPSFLANQPTAQKPSVFLKVLKVFGVALVLFLIIGAVGGYFYWQNLKKTPQYSLALLIDAARRDDQKQLMIWLIRMRWLMILCRRLRIKQSSFTGAELLLRRYKKWRKSLRL